MEHQNANGIGIINSGNGNYVVGAFCFCTEQLWAVEDNHTIGSKVAHKSLLCRCLACCRTYNFESLVQGDQYVTNCIEYIKTGITVDDSDMVAISKLQHLMVKLASESSELSHAILKGVEFGIAHPYPDSGTTILQKIIFEFNDVLGVARMLTELGFPVEPDEKLIQAKIDKVTRMMEVAKEYGVMSTVL